MAQRLTSFASRFTPQPSRPASPGGPEEDDIKNPQMYKLFPKTDPLVDGEECLWDCDSCTRKYPAKFSIDEEDELFGKVDRWDTHLIVATGKDDWIRDVADERGSIMEAVGKGDTKPANGVSSFPQTPPSLFLRSAKLRQKSKLQKMMLSASNMPVPEEDTTTIQGQISSTVLLLPAFTLIDHVTPNRVPALITSYVNASATNGTPLPHDATTTTTTPSPLPSPAKDDDDDDGAPALSSRPCPHRYLILLYSQKTRDARCGQSAPILRREFERHLRPLGLHRDLHDTRPGGVGIYFISHVGGHRYSANVMVYRRSDRAPGLKGAGGGAASNQSSNNNDNSNGNSGIAASGEASQCIWLARVRPQDCENIVRYTVLQGKVVKPESQLRGGFDRVKGLVSW